jgi:D-alanine-D-alanine ligase
MEILPEKAGAAWTVYSLEAKRNWKQSVNFACPAVLDRDTSRQVEKSALAAFNALGCRDVSRVDFRIREDGTPVFLEINPLPGLSAPPESSDLVLIATAVGLSYTDLVGEILRGALYRLG